MPKTENLKLYNFFAAPKKKTSKTIGGIRLLHLIHKGMMIEGKGSLAEEFDVSITTVERWIREGVPRETTEDETLWSFHRGRVARWRRELHGADIV